MSKYVRAFLATVTFVAVLLAVHYVHMRHFRVDVVLYAAIIDALIAVAICAGLLWGARQARHFTGLECILLLLFWTLGGYSFAISVPTVVDRSLSFYILEKLQQRGGGIEQARMADVFVKEYMVEHRLVDIRLTEQLESGTITIEHGCVRLTDKGQRFASMGRFYRAHFLPKHRLIMGGYSDDLTDPFRRSASEVDYRCR
ncbi:hypothetical protein [Luteimonas sp. TWI1437]|uniref:hypothetical protein n=1 Tax=unclassified Luteimonas TaxID=2629088 RepID=UPI00320896D9